MLGSSMKRISQIILITTLVSFSAAAQAAKSVSIDDQQWNELVTALEGENWLRPLSSHPSISKRFSPKTAPEVLIV